MSADHPMIDLLRLFTKPKCPDVSNNPGLRCFFDECALPTIDRQCITAVESAISARGAVLTDALAPVSSIFKCDFLILKIYAETFLGSWDLIPLASSVAWLSCADPKSILKSFPYLLKGLLNLSRDAPRSIAEFALKAAVLRYLEVEPGPWSVEACVGLFPTCRPYLVDVWRMIFERSEESEVRDYLLIVLRKSIFADPEAYKGCDFASVVVLLQPGLAKFDLQTLMLLGVMTKVKQDEAILNTIGLMPVYIQASLPADRTLPMLPLAIENGSVTSECVFDCEDTFPNGLTPCNLSVFDEIERLESVATHVHERFLVLFGGFFLGLEDVYSTCFFNAFADLLAQTRNTDLFIIFVLILRNTMKATNPHVFTTLIRSPIFGTALTLFEDIQPEHRIIFVLRHAIVDFFLHTQPSLLQSFFTELACSPIVFAEVLARVPRLLLQTELQDFLTQEMLAVIMRVSFVLWRFYKENPNSQLIPALQWGRSAIFVFFFDLLQDPKLRASCFSSSPFVGGFLARALEPSVCGSILAAFSTFLVSCTTALALEPSLRVVGGILHVCRSSIHPNESRLRRLGIDIIVLLNEAVVLNPAVAGSLQPVMGPVTAFLHSDPSRELLAHVLSMISHLSITSEAFRLSYSQIHEICCAGRFIESGGATDETMSILLGMISLSKNVTAARAPMFIVKRPSLIVLLFSFVRSRERLEFMLGYFERLCRHSLFNSKQCHKGELDLLLLEMMGSLERPFSFRGCAFDGLLDGKLAASAALPLFRSISLVRSSPSVATRLLLLLSPLEDRSFSPLALEILPIVTQFRSLFSVCQVPAIPIRGTSQPMYVIEDVPSVALEGEFTLQFWVLFDVTLSLTRNSKTALLTVCDDDEVGFCILLSGEGLLCRVMLGVGQSYLSAVLVSSFPRGTWTMVTLSARRPNPNDRSLFSFSFFLNDGLPDVFTLSYPEFRSQILRICIGGLLDADPRQEVADTIGYIGAFWCYEGFFTPPMVSNTFGSQTRSPDHGCIFGYPAPESHLVECAPAKQPVTLLTVLGCNSVFKFFVPFFGYVNEMPGKFAESLINFMGEILPREGLKGDVFALIGHLLMSADRSKLTYNLYLRFFGLIDHCAEKPARALIDHVLLNFDLWITADSTVLLRIVTHWATAFLNSCGHFLSLPLSSWLAQIRIFFWYEPREIGIIRGVDPRPRDPALDIAGCRQQIDRFLTTLFQGSLSRDDGMVLVAHAAACADERQQIAFISLLGAIGPHDPSIIEMLFCFLTRRRERLFVETLKAVYILADNEVSAYVSAAGNLDSYFATESLLSLILPILPDFPLLYPLAIRISLSLTRAHRVQTAHALQTIRKSSFSEIARTDWWFLWPAVLACDFVPDLRDVVAFVASVVLEDFSLSRTYDLLSLLDVLDSTGVVRVSDFQNELLLLLAIVGGMEPPERRAELFRLCVKGALVHPANSFQSELQRTFDESPFASDLDGRGWSCPSPSPIRRSATPFSQGLPNISRSRSLGFVALAAKARSFCLPSTAAEVLDALRSCPSGIDYQFGLMLPAAERSLIRAAAALPPSLPAEDPYAVIAAYFTAICVHDIGAPIQPSETVMRQIFAELKVEWGARYATQHRHLVRYLSEIIQTSKGMQSKIDGDVMELTAADLHETLEQKRVAEGRAAAQWTLILREIAHSWRGVAYSIQRSFHGTRHFAQSQLKKMPPSKPSCQLRSTDKSVYFSCLLIKIGKQIRTNCFLFSEQIVLDGCGSFHVGDVEYIFRRNRLHRPTALEFVLTNGNSYLVDFAPRSASEILRRIEPERFPIALIQSSAFKPFFKKYGETEAWQERKMSNFEYLLQINMFASRSFRDASIYPIFPWVLLNFQTFDLRNINDFRDLHYPVQAQTRQQREDAQGRVDFSHPIGPDNAMFLTAPSNPGIVWLWLSRLPPFNLISEEKDTFQNMQTALLGPALARCSSELPPECFCQPEIFENVAGFDIPEISLPSWASTAMEFVYRHRKALESDYVSDHLHEWIDLIFGVASAGARARERCNIYNPHLMSAVWEHASEADSPMIERLLTDAGHYPPPLFDAPHPPRLKRTVRCKNETFKANFEGANIQIAVVLTSDSRELKMASIHTDGSVMVHTVQRGSPVKSDEIGELPDPKIRSHAKSSSGNWLVVGTGNYVVKAKGIEECGRAPDKIERVAASGNHIVLSARDGTFWQANLRNLAESARICSALHQTPAVIAVNVEYHLLVIGTLEASILLYSLISGLFRMKVDLPGEIPERILVTDGWGFILVASQSRISLFDVNGKLLRSIGVTINIVAWCTWRDSKGFDFVGLADDNGKIFVCEAFYLEFGDYVAFCRGSVVALEFVNEVIGLTAITSAGSCFLIPIQSPD